MTPVDFAAAYVTTAREVSDGTGIDSAVLLAQWANETAWGTVVVGILNAILPAGFFDR